VLSRNHEKLASRGTVPASEDEGPSGRKCKGELWYSAK
jgi:hypothetical protein